MNVCVCALFMDKKWARKSQHIIIIIKWPNQIISKTTLIVTTTASV